MSIYKNCKLEKVFDRLSTQTRAYREYLIEISVTDEYPRVKTEYVPLSHKYGLYKELQELKFGRKEVVYGTYGMGNIDITVDRVNGTYCIEYSPIDGVCDYYFFEIKDFEDNFISALAPACTKDLGE